MTYTTPSKPLDSALVAAVKQQLRTSLQTVSLVAPVPIIGALAALRTQLPETLDATLCLTWATAMEQLAAELAPDLELWVQALEVEGYNLRLQARAPFPA